MELTITRKYFLFKKKSKRPISSNAIWRTREGEKIPVKELTDSHLHNCINFIARKIRNENASHLKNYLKIFLEEKQWRDENN